MRLKTITILTLMLMPVISQAQPQQYQQVNDILYTASSDAYAQERCKLDVYYPVDQYAPLTYVRPDAPPIVIISGDRELELYGRYEEQAYFWRMLKLIGHKDVTLYEMQGYDHGAMAQPAYYILKQHIKRLTENKTNQK